MPRETGAGEWRRTGQEKAWPNEAQELRRNAEVGAGECNLTEAEM